MDWKEFFQIENINKTEIDVIGIKENNELHKHKLTKQIQGFENKLSKIQINALLGEYGPYQVDGEKWTYDEYESYLKGVISSLSETYDMDYIKYKAKIVLDMKYEEDIFSEYKDYFLIKLNDHGIDLDKDYSVAKPFIIYRNITKQIWNVNLNEGRWIIFNKPPRNF